MKQIIKALVGQRVEVVYDGGESQGSGILKAVKADKAEIDDCFGGAFWFPVSEVKSVRVDAGQPALIITANWQKDESRTDHVNNGLCKHGRPLVSIYPCPDCKYEAA